MTKENNVPQEDNDLENKSIVNTSDDEDPMPKNYIFLHFMSLCYGDLLQV